MDDELEATRLTAGIHQKRQERSVREHGAQVAALGVLMTQPKLLKGIETNDFIDSGMGAVVESLKSAIENPESGVPAAAKGWLESHLGVVVGDGEKLQEAVLRTVKENSLRKRASDVLHRLARTAENYSVSDSAFLEQAKKEMAGL